MGDTASAANQVSVTLGHVNSATLGLTGDLSTQADAQAYMGAVDSAIGNLNLAESGVGNAQNQLSYQTANLQTMDTNTQSADRPSKTRTMRNRCRTSRSTR